MTAPRTEQLLPLLVADIYECAGALRRAGDELAARVGQTQARWQLLSVVSDGDWTASTAARRLGVSRQAVQRVVDELVAAGLLRVEANPAHRRSPLLRLSARGREALGAITVAAGSWRRAVAAEVAGTDLAGARRALQALTAACREVDAAGGGPM